METLSPPLVSLSNPLLEMLTRILEEYVTSVTHIDNLLKASLALFSNSSKYNLQVHIDEIQI